MTAPAQSVKRPPINFAALSPEAQAAVKTRSVTGAWDLKKLLRLLDELARFDEQCEEEAGRAKSRLILFVVLSFFSLFLGIFGGAFFPPFFLLPVVVIAMTVRYGLRYRQLDNADLIDDFRVSVRPALRLIVNDLNPEEKLKVRLDLSGPIEKKKTGTKELPPGTFQKLTEHTYTDPWCELRLSMADGCTAILEIENVFTKADRRYRGRSGKTKWKSKWTKDVTMSVTLLPPASVTWDQAKLEHSLEKGVEKTKQVEKQGVTGARLAREWSIKGAGRAPKQAPPAQHIVGLFLRLYGAMTPAAEASK